MSRLAESGVLELDPDRYLYLRARLVSALEKHGPNDNGDAFEEDELKKRYATFVNSGVYLDHDNDDEHKSVGWICDAWYDPRGWVEGILVVDKQMVEEVRPGLIKKITDPNHPQHLTDGSMGCMVQFSICSLCGNRATTPEEYCDHIREQKGRPGVYEINKGVTFFEWSLLDPAGSEGGIGADPDAKVLQAFGSAKSVSPLSKFVVRRKTSGCGQCVKSCNQGRFPDAVRAALVKEARQMSTAATVKQAAPEDKGNRGNPTETMKDAGEYGDPAKVDKDTKKQTGGGNGGSGTETSRGNPSVTQQDGGDYGLKNAARAAGAAVQAAILATAAGPALGGEPEQVVDNKEKMDSARESAADSVSPSSSPSKSEPPADSGSKEAIMGPSVQKPASKQGAADDSDIHIGGVKVSSREVAAAVVEKGIGTWLKDLLGLGTRSAASSPAGGGNPQQVTDRDEKAYGDPAKVDKDLKAQADAGGKATDAERTQQVSTGNTTPEERQKQQEITAANESKILEHIVARMGEGQSYEKAESEARSRFAAVKTAQGTADISKGNLATKYGPQTTPLADAENNKQEKDLRSESSGSSVATEVRDYRGTVASIREAQSVADVFKGDTAADSEASFHQTNAFGDSPSKSDSKSDSDSKSAQMVTPTAPAAPPAPAAMPGGAMGAADSASPAPAMPESDADSASDSMAKAIESKADDIGKMIEKKKEEAALHSRAGDVGRARMAVKIVQYLSVENERMLRAAALIRGKAASLKRAPTLQLKKHILASLAADIVAMKKIMAEKKVSPLVPGDLAKLKTQTPVADSRVLTAAQQEVVKLRGENEELRAALRTATANFRGALKSVTAERVAELQEQMGLDPGLSFQERVAALSEFTKDALDGMFNGLKQAAARMPGRGMGPSRNVFALNGLPPRTSSLRPNTQPDEDSELAAIFRDKAQG